MCKPASFIVVNGEPPKWSKHSDSHEVIRSEHKLPHNTDTLTANVQVEITPPNGNYFETPLKQWVFKVDQDRLPKWWDAKVAEVAVRKELKAWAKQKLILSDTVLIDGDGEYYIAGNITVEYVRGSATINYVGGSATIKDVGGSATINYVGGSATINYVGGLATIKDVRDSATINYVGGSATIKDVRDSATIKDVGGSATIKDVGGSATINYVRDSATINYVGGSATIKDVRGSATIIVYNTVNPNTLTSATAVMIDRSVNPPKCYVGVQK